VISACQILEYDDNDWKYYQKLKIIMASKDEEDDKESRVFRIFLMIEDQSC